MLAWALKLFAAATGASLTALMVRSAVSDAVENEVLPPLTVASPRPPLVPLVVSHAWSVMAGVMAPLMLARGW